MIPDRILINIPCDCCKQTVGVTVSEEDIDGAGWDMAIEGALTDRGWGVYELWTFCPGCMEKARNMALQELARGATRDLREAAHVSV